MRVTDRPIYRVEERIDEYRQLMLENTRLKRRMLDLAERLDEEYASQHVVLYPLINNINQMGKLQEQAARLIDRIRKAEQGTLYED